MSDAIITVENLSKRYIIGHQRARGEGLRHAIERAVMNPFGWLRTKRKEWRAEQEEFWALKDVSFEIKQGEVVGIIGRNGAGKSTLLKTLSRITEPTRGRIRIRGRVASLLEVGTGFHQELTGRENIFLNGAILGMSRVEIKRKLDEIVAFSEVEKFLDTPVKRYSSGMYVRLAFAVAAHLEPEILIVDEVLAVGDAAFQKKCLGRMADIAQGGRTIMFVSHNMSAIGNLCSSCIYLKDGKFVTMSNTEQAINKYLLDLKHTLAATSLRSRKDRQGSGRVRIVDFYVTDASGVRLSALKSGGEYNFVMKYERRDDGETMKNVVGSIGITDTSNQIICLLRSNFTNQNFPINSKQGRVECGVKDVNLAMGTYNVTLFLSNEDSETLDWVTDAAQIIVDGGDFFGTGNFGLPSLCKVLSRSEWRSL